jgi:hypothetical protein
MAAFRNALLVRLLLPAPALALVFIALLIPAAAIALCATPLDPWSQLQASDTVFYGIARTIHRIPANRPWDNFAIVVDFTVLARWKGAARDSVVVETDGRSSMGGYPHFKEGVTFLVYATGVGDTVFTGYCDRTCADSAAYADMANLGKPVFDRREGMGWRELRFMTETQANGLKTIKGPASIDSI